MGRVVLFALAFVVPSVAAGAGCTRGEPPTWDAGGASPSIAPLPASVASLPISPAAKPSSTGAPTSTSTSTATATPPDSSALPQTRDRPGSDSAAFNARVAALWDAIVHDDPDRALTFFFPVGAYQQVKDIPDPASDWKRRLVAAYARDIHAFHKRLGKNADSAKFVSFDVPDDRAKWVDPGNELNKLGYWRVFGTRLRYVDDGKEKTFEIMSLISWRGEWFVVHLSSFK